MHRFDVLAETASSFIVGFGFGHFYFHIIEMPFGIHWHVCTILQYQASSDFAFLAVWEKKFAHLIRLDERRLYDLSNVMKYVRCSCRFAFKAFHALRLIHRFFFFIAFENRTERMNQYRINDTFIFGFGIKFP